LGKTAEKLKKMQQNVATYHNGNSRSVRDHQPKSPRLAERYQHSDEVDFINTEQTCRPQTPGSKNPACNAQVNFAKSLGIRPNQNPTIANPKNSNFTYAGAKTLRLTKETPKPTKDTLRSGQNPKPSKRIFSNSFDNTMPSSKHQTQLDKENMKKKYSREIVGGQVTGFENFFLGRNTVGPQVYNHLYQDEEEIPKNCQNFIKDYRQQNFSLRGKKNKKQPDLLELEEDVRCHQVPRPEPPTPPTGRRRVSERNSQRGGSKSKLSDKSNLSRNSNGRDPIVSYQKNKEKCGVSPRGQSGTPFCDILRDDASEIVINAFATGNFENCEDENCEDLQKLNRESQKEILFHNQNISGRLVSDRDPSACRRLPKTGSNKSIKNILNDRRASKRALNRNSSSNLD
jgi:hypothetical protein